MLAVLAICFHQCFTLQNDMCSTTIIPDTSIIDSFQVQFEGAFQESFIDNWKIDCIVTDSSKTDCIVFNAIFNSISVIVVASAPIHNFLEFFLTSTLHNNLSKPMAAFPQNRYRNNRQWWERNESCFNEYHKSTERVLGGAWNRTSYLLFLTAVHHWLSYGAQ